MLTLTTLTSLTITLAVLVALFIVAMAVRALVLGVATVRRRIERRRNLRKYARVVDKRFSRT